MPLLLLWTLRDDLVELYGDVVEIWRDWATDVRGECIHPGHHVTEEAPVELAARIATFLRPQGGLIVPGMRGPT